ncbi:MAG: type I-E CRISPR-associated protein Cas7/Cse4/CasC [Desulfomonilaceae bacterium]
MFLQLHILTSYPPSNLNRDELGRPKTAVMGGVNRLRISSQSLKRAWRTSSVFEESLKGHLGVRTKMMGVKAYEKLLSLGVNEKNSREWSKKIAEVFGKLSKPSKTDALAELKIEQLAHFSPEEELAILDLASRLASANKGPTEAELKLLKKNHTSVDIALFGRMLASKPEFNVEASAQVAHAITTHKVAIEDDFFTAVDDLNRGEEDMGAGHLGETEFGAGIFYLYVCVDCTSLLENLSGETDLAKMALQALTEASTKISPTGKQATFASRSYASYVCAEKGNQQPRSLAVSFLNPVKGDNLLFDSIKRLEETRQSIDKVYGACSDESFFMNALNGQGSLNDLVVFAKGTL